MGEESLGVAPTIEVQLLGPCRYLLNGEELDLGTPKQALLAAALAVRSPSVVSRDRLIDYLWGEDPPSSAGSSFAAYLSNLRRIIEPNRSRGAEPTVLITRRPGYVLDIPANATDLHQFRSLVAQVDQADAVDRIALLDSALGLVQGPALGDVRHEPSMLGITTQIDEEVLVARERRFALTIENGTARPEQLDGLIAENPLREHLRALHAHALYQQGRQADALNAISATRSMMLDELGLDPGAELQQLETDILNQSPRLAASISPAQASIRSSDVVETKRQVDQATDTTYGDPTYGRDREMAVVDRAFDDLKNGKGTLLLISGDMGVGKSHLALQIMAEARRRGVYAGSGIYTDAAGRPPLSAWNDARRVLAQRLGDRMFEISPPELLVEALEFVGGDINGSFSEEALGQPEELQRMLEVMRSLAFHMSQHEPLSIVVDDFHLADEVSLAAIESWGRNVEESTFLLVVVYRHDEFSRLPGCAQWLRAIGDAPRTVRLALGGLDQNGVGDLARSFGLSLTKGEVSELTNRTGGNPLFVSQLCRLAVETKTPVLSTNLPGEVLTVVRERLNQLPSEVVDVLTTASLSESSIDPEIDAVVQSLDADLVDDLLLQAVDDGLLMHDPSTPGNYRFTNALTRETLSMSVGPRKRARLHAHLGETLLDGASADPAITIAAARHLCLGARSGTAQRGADLALQAGRQSIDTFGYSTAISIMSLGLDALTFDPQPDPVRRLELLRWRGLAQQSIDLGSEALDDFREAFRIAVSLGDPITAAEVALAAREGTGLARARSGWNPGQVALGMIDEAIALLRARPEAQGSNPHVLPDLLSASAADGVAGAGLDPQESYRLTARAEEAVELAASDAAAALPDAMLRRILTSWIDTPAEEHLPAIERVVDSAQQHDKVETEIIAHALGCVAEIERGDIDAARARVEVGQQRVERSGCTESGNHLRTMPYVLDAVTGRNKRVEDHALRDSSEHRSLGPLAANELRLIASISRFLRGDADGALDASLWPENAASRRPSIAATLALMQAEAGQLELARKTLDIFDHREHLRSETGAYSGRGWAMALATRAMLDDEREVRQLYDRLLTLSGRQVLPGPGTFYLLPVDYYLGVGAQALSEHESADGHFEIATRWAERIGSTDTIRRIQRIT